MGEQELKDRAERRKNMDTVQSIWVSSPTGSRDPSEERDEPPAKSADVKDRERKESSDSQGNDDSSDEEGGRKGKGKDKGKDKGGRSDDDSEGSDDDSSDSEDERRRKSKSKKKDSKHKKRDRESKKSKKSKKEKEKERKKSSKKKSKKRRRDSSDDDDSDDESEVDEGRGRAPSEEGAAIGQSDSAYEEKLKSLMDGMTEEERQEAREFAEAVQGHRQGEEEEEVGPMMPPRSAQELVNKKVNYGGALMSGEGAAIAAFVQQNKRIPRRGEVGYSGDEIQNLEAEGFVMSGSRHQRMNAVRLRKENQVYSAEEKRALALYNYEEAQARESEIMGQFKEMVTAKFKKLDS